MFSRAADGVGAVYSTFLYRFRDDLLHGPNGPADHAANGSSELPHLTNGGTLLF